MKLSLYYAEYCPFCQRVLQPLRRQQWPVTLCDVMAEPKHNKDLIAGGGRSTVPCLRIEDNQGSETWMYESLDILNFLQRHFSQQ